MPTTSRSRSGEPRTNFFFDNSSTPIWLPLPPRPYVDLAMGKRPAEELYDLRADPGEVSNVVDQPRHADTRRALRQWVMRVTSPGT